MAFELCLPNLIDSVVEEFFDEALSKVGFRKVRDRFYVRSRIAEMNDVIEFFRDKLNLPKIGMFKEIQVPGGRSSKREPGRLKREPMMTRCACELIASTRNGHLAVCNAAL